MKFCKETCGFGSPHFSAFKRMSPSESRTVYWRRLKTRVSLSWYRTMHTLLIIDDDIELCEMLERYLDSEGFLVASVHTPQAGGLEALSGKYALVILDVTLPGENGFEVLKRVRAGSRVPVLMLTARGDEVDRIFGLEIGADDYLPKPFNPRELVARVRAILRRTDNPGDPRPEGHAKLLIVGDFTGREDDRMLEEREPINIDKDNFDEVLKAQNLNLDLAIPNKLSEDPEEEMSVSLKFETIRDFEPEAIARKTPELNKLIELREALASLKGPMSNRPEFRKKIQQLIKDEAAKEKLLKELKIEE